MTFDALVLRFFRRGLDTLSIASMTYRAYGEGEFLRDFEAKVLSALHRAREAERMGRAA